MAYRLAIASTASCTAGAILTGEGIFSHTWELAAGGIGFLAAGVAGGLAATMRYTLRQHQARTREELHEISERRRDLDLDMQLRERDLAEREAALDRRTSTLSLRLASYAKSLDEARNEKAALRNKIVELQTEVDEVCDERNQLITQELLAAQSQFTSKAYGELRVAAGAGRPMPFPHARRRPSEVTALVRDHES